MESVAEKGRRGKSHCRRGRKVLSVSFRLHTQSRRKERLKIREIDCRNKILEKIEEDRIMG